MLRRASTASTASISLVSGPILILAVIVTALSGPGCLQTTSGTASPPAPTTSGGAVGGPQIDCVPRSIVFPPIAANQQEGASVTCTNTGSNQDNENLLITIASTGSAVFGATFFSYPATGLPPSQKGVINLTYAPVTVSDDVGALKLTSNAGTVTIPIVGYGLNRQCQLSVPATNLDFGNTTVGTTRGPSSFAIDNDSTAICQIEAPITVFNDASGSFQVVGTNLQSSGSEYTLSPAGGGSSELVVEVSFTPKTKGTVIANIGDFIAVSGTGQ